jgi:hypothetical protein
MTERIDLDELDAGNDDEDAPNPGDWFWREEGDPPDEPEAVTDVKTTSGTTAGDAGSDATESDALDTDVDSEDDANAASGPIPRVPRENEDRPVGVPEESGGAGAGAGESTSAGASDADAPASDSTAETQTTTTDEQPEASGPHGGGADDMTLAFTYEAATQLADFGRVAADAYGWADWVGIVGRVPAHVVNKFQRDRNVDLDFFNGASADPGERLARIGPSSMFYAKRMVVVGVEGEDEEIAEKADWEFVPLAEAAEKADWDVTE